MVVDHKCERCNQDEASLIAASAPVAPTQSASKRLIGWRTPDYLKETADAAIAKNWSVHHDLLPIFEGDVHTKLATPQAAPVAPAPQPAPMPYPTDAQIDVVYEQTMGQHLRSQDAPAVRRFGRAMFLCAWNAATPAVAPEPTDADRAARGAAQAIQPEGGA